MLAARRVEVAEQHDASLGARGEPGADRLEGQHLDAVRPLADRRVDGEDRHGLAVEPRGGGERALRPRAGGRRERAELVAGGHQDAERPPAGVGARGLRRQVVERAAHVRQAGGGEAHAPQRRRAARDLLQRDEVGVHGGDRRRLLLEAGDAAGDVPGQQAAQ